MMRQRLKRDTDAVHRRLDDSFSALDLSQPSDYRTFLAANADAYGTVLAALPASSALAAEVAGLRALLLRDFTALTGEPYRSRLSSTPDISHPLGIQYVLAGSHFGKRVLTRRWSKSADERVLAAGTFLENDVLRSIWPATLLELEQISPGSEDANVIVHSAAATFSIFQDSLTANGETRGHPTYGPQAAQRAKNRRWPTCSGDVKDDDG